MSDILATKNTQQIGKDGLVRIVEVLMTPENELALRESKGVIGQTIRLDPPPKIVKLTMYQLQPLY